MHSAVQCRKLQNSWIFKVHKCKTNVNTFEYFFSNQAFEQKQPRCDLLCVVLQTPPSVQLDTFLLRWYEDRRKKATKLEKEVYIVACVLMLHIVFFTFDVSGEDGCDDHLLMLWNGLSSTTPFAAHITPICLLAQSIPQQHTVQKILKKSHIQVKIVSQASYVYCQTKYFLVSRQKQNL